jgi:predicted ester cyclase
VAPSIFYRVDGNRIAEHWMQFDAAFVMSQLQAQPAVP